MSNRVLSAGYTMVEMVTVVCIAGILMAIAVPSFRYLTTANRITGEINGLLGDMQFARVEAIKEGSTVTVCPSANGTGCQNTAWSNGWLVFSDLGNDQKVDPGDTIWRIQKPFTSTDVIANPGAVLSVTFNREGFAFGLGGAATLELHDATNNQSFTRCLAVSNTGLLTTQTYNQSIGGGQVCQ